MRLLAFPINGINGSGELRLREDTPARWQITTPVGVICGIGEPDRFFCHGFSFFDPSTKL